MEEADELCDRIAIIDHGVIIKLDTPEKLKDSLGGDVIKIGTKRPKELVTLVKKKRIAISAMEHDGIVEITAKDGSKALPKIIGFAKAAGISIDYSTLKRPTLEDVFISLTGKELRVEQASGMNQMTRMWMGRR
jgi:ABC-2 type transport system ATP-binding protein